MEISELDSRARAMGIDEDTLTRIKQQCFSEAGDDEMQYAMCFMSALSSWVFRNKDKGGGLS